MHEFETIEVEIIVRRLGNSNSGEQVSAVISSAIYERKAQGILDEVNTSIALMHLARALVGKDKAASAIENTTWLLNEEELAR